MKTIDNPIKGGWIGIISHRLDKAHEGLFFVIFITPTIPQLQQFPHHKKSP